LQLYLGFRLQFRAPPVTGEIVPKRKRRQEKEAAAGASA
jgi:hypothetical protein